MQAKNTNLSFIDGGGETGALIRSIDWSKNPLGPPEGWPQPLRTSLGILLNSKFPMFLLWGPEYICFYNDAYRPSLGDNGKHPTAMGQRGKECWPEIWDFVIPMFTQIMGGGEAIWLEDQLLPIYRNGKLDDVYWTFSYSPVKDEEGKPAGIFVAVTETTGKVHTLKEIKQSRDDLQFTIDAAQLGTWDYDPQTNSFTGNTRLKSWFGLPGDSEIDLGNAIKIIAERDRDRVASAIARALDANTGGEYDAVYNIINPVTGIERVVHAKGRAYFNNDGVAYKLSGTLQDVTDESILHRQLMESEANLRAMVLQAPIAMCVLKGADYVVDVANEGILGLWGKTLEQTLNKPLFEGLPEVKGQGLEELLYNVFTTGERFVAYERPVALPRASGMQTYYINFVYAPFIKDETIQGIIVVASDVTPQVIARRKIEDAEERARLAMDAVEMGTYDLYYPTGEIVTSPRFKQIFGLDDTTSHQDFVDVIHPDDVEMRARAHEEALKTGILRYVTRIICPDKSVRWIQAAGKVFYDENGAPLRLLGTIIDITEAKKAQLEILEMNQRLAIALEAGKLGSYELNLETGSIVCNDQFKENFGLACSSGFTFANLMEIVVPEHSDILRNDVAYAIANHAPYNTEFKVKWHDGSEHWLRASGKVTYDVDDKAVGIIGVSFDITDHKSLHQQKDDFISIASHELKTPVTSIKAYTQVLERMLAKKGEMKEAAMIGRMDVQVNRLTSLIGDLLDVTKINSGRLQFNDQYFNLGELVHEMIEDLQRTTDKHTLVNNFTYTGTVFADRDRIAQVVINLISNAIKYSPQPGEIIIRSSIQNDEVKICVQDFGVGISQEKQDRVFEQFYRVSGNKQHTFPGLGLGLYISSEIVKREGGRIWVDSVEGKGSTFCFVLPVKGINRD